MTNQVTTLRANRRRTVRSTGPVWVLSLLLIAFLVAGHGCSSLPSKAGRRLPGLRNFGVVDNGKIYRSAQPEEPEGYETFRWQGGRSVINLRKDLDEQGAIAAAGLKPYCFKLDPDDPPAIEEIERIVRTMADPGNQPVLVHCRLGQDRTGLIVASYRIIAEGWTYDRAYDELKTYAFAGLEVHRAITRRLKEVAARYGRGPLASVGAPLPMNPAAAG